MAWQGYHFQKKGVRINAVCPGPTDTPLARANADLWLTFAQDYRDDTGSATLTPEDIGKAMIMLNSAAAASINGITLNVDQGHAMASITGSFAPRQADHGPHHRAGPARLTGTRRASRTRTAATSSARPVS
ncbi:hypothetical protein IWGMT90018_23280 [Mycobacterium kiyosense]|nr:hypothetical protein IWGMT90018_23280 [Mycobacterium kiyosense]